MPNVADTGIREDRIAEIVSGAASDLNIALAGVPLLTYAATNCVLALFTDQNNPKSVPDPVLVKIAIALEQHQGWQDKQEKQRIRCEAISVDFSRYASGNEISFRNLRIPNNSGTCSSARLANYVMALHERHEAICKFRHNKERFVWNRKTLSDGSVPESACLGEEAKRLPEDPNLWLSNWHRVYLEKTSRAGAIDLDIVLYDKGSYRPRMLIESKHLSYREFAFGASITATVARALKVPAFLIRQISHDAYAIEQGLQKRTYQEQLPISEAQLRNFIREELSLSGGAR